MDTSEIARLERSADAGWPAEEMVTLGPWLLRSTHGVSHRANSVFTARGQIKARHLSAPQWAQWISEAEAFYHARNQPTIFQISPATTPDDLDAILESRGYPIQKPSGVWRAGAGDVAIHRPNTGIGEDHSSEEADEPWLACAFGEDSETRRVKQQICRRISHARNFASIRHNGIAISCGLAVAAGEAAWVYCMHTDPEWQRRGLATQILRKLAVWSQTQQREQIYLQVQGDNSCAMNLYRKMSFVCMYPYHYREMMNVER